MHEFELGVWKAFYTHILRLLVAEGGDAIPIFNSRFVILLFCHYTVIAHSETIDFAKFHHLGAMLFGGLLRM